MSGWHTKPASAPSMKENSIKETLSSMDREGTDRHSGRRETTGKLEDSKTSCL